MKMQIFLGTESWRKILEGLKRKVDIFIGTKNIFNPNCFPTHKNEYLFWLASLESYPCFKLLSSVIVSLAGRNSVQSLGSNLNHHKKKKLLSSTCVFLEQNKDVISQICFCCSSRKVIVFYIFIFKV